MNHGQNFYLIAFLVISYELRAVDLLLDDLDQRDFDNITRELSANFTHSLVSPASALGQTWGFEVGGMVGAAYAPKIGDIVKRRNPQIKTNHVPFASYVAAVTLPLGITFEGRTFPTRDVKNVRFGHYSGALKWTPTALRKKSWYHVAFKGHAARSALDITQILNNNSTQYQNVRTTLQMRNLVWGGSLTLGLSLFVFEPYIGGGILGAKQKFFTVGPGGASAFNPGATLGDPQHGASRANSLYSFGGLQVNLFFFHWSAEYARLFDTYRVSTKISFGI